MNSPGVMPGNGHRQHAWDLAAKRDHVGIVPIGLAGLQVNSPGVMPLKQRHGSLRTVARICGAGVPHVG